MVMQIESQFTTEMVGRRDILPSLARCIARQLSAVPDIVQFTARPSIRICALSRDPKAKRQAGIVTTTSFAMRLAGWASEGKSVSPTSLNSNFEDSRS